MAGLTFDEFRVGQVFTHQPSRTVTETDNLLFSALTMNPQPLHLDAEFAKSSHFGQRLVNSIFTLGLVVGLSVGETTLGTTVGNLGMEKVEFPKPVFIGDTIYPDHEVVGLERKRSAGLLVLKVALRNQRGEVVLEGEHRYLIAYRPAA